MLIAKQGEVSLNSLVPLSFGAIIGIAIGCLVFSIAILAVAYFKIIKPKLLNEKMEISSLRIHNEHEP